MENVLELQALEAPEALEGQGPDHHGYSHYSHYSAWCGESTLQPAPLRLTARTGRERRKPSAPFPPWPFCPDGPGRSRQGKTAQDERRVEGMAGRGRASVRSPVPEEGPLAWVMC